jgi:hypothetical protein
MAGQEVETRHMMDTPVFRDNSLKLHVDYMTLETTSIVDTVACIVVAWAMAR